MSGRALGLREVEDAFAVGILEIIGEADLGLAIDAVLVAPACDPGAARGAPPIAEVEPSADVRWRPDYKLSRRKQGFESPRERQ